MSFRDNLQHLRATRNMTQEQLAMLVGVSRQSVTKWEAERSYPEMDKLLKICSIFDCTLDELVTGDLTGRAPDPARAVPTGAPPTDTCGYDEHMRSFARHIAFGAAALLASVGVAALIPPLYESISGFMAGRLVEATAAAFVLLGVIVATAFCVPVGIDHVSFNRQHPFVADFYTADDRRDASRTLAYGIFAGVAIILVGAMLCVFADATWAEDIAAGVMVLLTAPATWLFVYAGIMYWRTHLAERNHDIARELTEDDIDAADIGEEERERLRALKHRRPQDQIIGATCGIIMLLATIVALVWLFLGVSEAGSVATNPGFWDLWSGEGGLAALFWLPWMIGGILCGIAAIVISVALGGDREGKRGGRE